MAADLHLAGTAMYATSFTTALSFAWFIIFYNITITTIWFIYGHVETAAELFDIVSSCQVVEIFSITMMVYILVLVLHLLKIHNHCYKSCIGITY